MMIEEYEYDMGEMKISLLLFSLSLSLSGFVFQECVGGIGRVVEGIICVLHFFSSLCAFWSWVWVSWICMDCEGGRGLAFTPQTQTQTQKPTQNQNRLPSL
uniref:Transmembrane protein n=1 Tax=Opuntia streptacantha TaxID=393608 RepID=A0A7C9DL28_OPUST